MQGLQVLRLYNASINSDFICLTIPSSVVECELSRIRFRDLTFENEYTNSTGLKLKYYYCEVQNKLTIRRELESISSIEASSSVLRAPNVLECNFDFLHELTNSDSLGCIVIGSTRMILETTTLLLYYSSLIDTSGITWPGLTFKAIYNYTYKAKSAFNNFLYTSNWYPNVWDCQKIIPIF